MFILSSNSFLKFQWLYLTFLRFQSGVCRFLFFNAHVLPVLSFIITYFLVLTHLPLALQRYKHISTVAILVFCITSLVRSEHSNC